MFYHLFYLLASDGSNHDNCCLDRGVHRACLDLCHQGLPELTDEIPICFTDEQVNSLISCAVTGAGEFTRVCHQSVKF